MKSQHEVCTMEAPSKNAAYHPDASILSRKEVGGEWPRFRCPNCGIDTALPEWDTGSAKKLLSDM